MRSTFIRSPVDLHPHPDRHAFPDPHAVVVHEGFRLVDAVGDFANARPCRRLAVIHDRRNAADVSLRTAITGLMRKPTFEPIAVGEAMRG